MSFYLFNHLSVHSFIFLFIYLFTNFSINSFLYSFTYIFFHFSVHSFLFSFIPLFIHFSIHSLLYSFIYLSIYFSLHLFISLFTYSLSRLSRLSADRRLRMSLLVRPKTRLMMTTHAGDKLAQPSQRKFLSTSYSAELSQHNFASLWPLQLGSKMCVGFIDFNCLLWKLRHNSPIEREGNGCY